MNPSIQFTTEEQKQDGSMPFLDILVTPQEDGTLTSRVYRKATHTDQYLQWDSHHNLACKYSVINTLSHITKAVCSNSQLTAERRVKTSGRSPDTMQVSQMGCPEDFKGSRKQEEQEKRKKHIHAEEMSHSGAIHKRAM